MAKRFQFSIKWILAATAVAAIFAVVLVAERSWWIGATGGFLMAAIPALATVACVETWGRMRLLSIGVAVASALAAISFVTMFGHFYMKNWWPGPSSTDRLVGGLAYVSAFCLPLLCLCTLAPAIGVLCVGFGGSFDDKAPVAATSNRRPGFQFSILSMFFATAVVAVVAGVSVARPTWWLGATESFLNVAFPALATVAVVMSQNYLRSFFIGVALSSASGAFTFVTIFGHIYEMYWYKHDFAVEGMCNALEQVSAFGRPVLFLCVCAPVIGVLCVVFHWLIGDQRST